MLEVTKSALSDFKYILASVFVLFFVGVKDDIIGTSPIKRLGAHILVALIIVLMADIRVKSMHGIFNIDEVPFWSSIFISLFAIIVVINAMNFIDGIDGLAGGIGFIAAAIFGVWFYLAQDVVMSLLSFSLAGSLLAFLFYNFSPAKIFMGDSGSTTIGLLLSVLAIKVIGTPKAEVSTNIIGEIQRPVFVMAVLAYPLIDTLRIFVYRTVKGHSPFEADRNHIHHTLLDTGMNHRSVSLILCGANLVIISFVVFFRELSPTILFICSFTGAALLAQVPFFFKKKKSFAQMSGNGHSKVSEEVKKQLLPEKEF